MKWFGCKESGVSPGQDALTYILRELSDFHSNAFYMLSENKTFILEILKYDSDSPSTLSELRRGIRFSNAPSHKSWRIYHVVAKRRRMVRPAGFEPTTSRLGILRSILLSYGRVKVFYCSSYKMVYQKM